MRSFSRHRCSAAVLILATSLFSTASIAETGPGPSAAAPPNRTTVEQQQAKPAAPRGMLGVKVQGIDQDTAEALGLADPKGALVTEVIPNGPAAEAGLKANDAILSLNGQSITDGQDLASQISNKTPGTSVDLRIKRAGGEQTIKVNLGASTAPNKEASASEPSEHDKSPKLGLMLTNSANGEGALIAEVKAGSDAANKGLTTGDLILQVEGKMVTNAADVVESVKALQDKGRKAVLLLVKSGDQTRAVPVRFGVVG